MRFSSVIAVVWVVSVVWALGTAGAASSTKAPAGKYYVLVRGVDRTAAPSHDLDRELAQLEGLFTEELKKHPEFMLDRPEGMPTDPDDLVAWLRSKKLKAFEVSLKVLSVTRDLRPPPPGKQYRVLVRGIRLSVVGDTLPEKILAIGGDGESEVGAEVGKHADLGREGEALLLECSKTAIAQAIDMTLAKLDLAERGGKLAPKKKH